MAQFGIYIHWPFCESKCPYCDFNSHVSGIVDEAAWRDAYLAELNRYASKPKPCRDECVFWWGYAQSYGGRYSSRGAAADPESLVGF